MWLYGCDRRQSHTVISLAIEMLEMLKTRLIQISYAHKFMHIRTYKYSIDICTYMQIPNHSRAVLGCVFQCVRSCQSAKSHIQQAFQRFSPKFAHTHIHKCDRAYVRMLIGCMYT